MIRHKCSYFRNILPFIVLINYLCCTSPKVEETPKLDISKDNLVNIMIDLEVADQAVRTYPSNKRDSIDSTFLAQILEIYKIDSLSLAEQFKIVESDKKLYLEIQTKVSEALDTLSKQEK